MANQEQIKAIYTLLGKFGLRDEKESLVRYFSNNRTESTRALRDKEAAALIGHLKSMDVTDTGSDKMRKKILSMAHEMNWNLPGETRIVDGKVKTKINMQHVNSWCEKYGYLHKPLDAYTYQELPRLVTQFEEVYKQHLKKV